MADLASQYQVAAIKTASPAELTLMLYNGVIKFCNIAIMGIEEKNILKAHTNLMKSQKIIRELKETLNFKYEVAKDFDLVYSKILRNLVDANLKKDIEKINEALDDIRSMRDIWVKIMKEAK